MKEILLASKAIVIRNNQILFVRQNYHNKVYWDLPGGKLEFGESPLEALSREVMEETGLEITSSKLIGTWRFFGKKVDDFQIECITYLCTVKSYEVNIHNNPGDHIEAFKWVSKKEFLENDYEVPNQSLKELIRSL